MYQFVIPRTQLVCRSNGRKLWIWRVGVGYSEGFWHSRENGASWPQERAFLYLWTKPCFSFCGTGRGTVSCSHQQTKQGINHFAGCMLKRSATKSDRCSGNRVIVIASILFRKKGPFRLQDYCLEQSSYMIRGRQRRIYLYLESNCTHVLSSRLRKVGNVQPESTAGGDCTTTPHLRTHRALNIAMFSHTKNRTTILYVQTHNDKQNTNSKIPRAQPQLQLN